MRSPWFGLLVLGFLITFTLLMVHDPFGKLVLLAVQVVAAIGVIYNMIQNENNKVD